MEEERNVGILGLVKSGIMDQLSKFTGIGSGGNLMDYVKENATSEKDLEYLRNKAGLIGSDYATALIGNTLTGLTNLDDLIFNKRGTYRGQTQDITDLMVPGFYERQLEKHNVNSAPDLLSIYLGDVTPESQGLKMHDKSPSKGYRFSPGPVYDVEEYVSFDGIKTDRALLNKILRMKTGDAIKLNEDDVFKYSSIDMGRQNWSIGKEKNGQYYVALADVWDFAGDDYGGQGELMEYIGAKPINMYGRFPLILEEHLQIEQY